MLWLISVVILLILLELFAILLKFSPTRSQLKFDNYILVYDDGCGICTSLAYWSMRRSKNYLQLIGFSDLPYHGVLDDISEGDIVRSAHFITPHGIEYHRGEAITKVLRLIIHPSFVFILDFPFFRGFREIGYSLFASQRSNISRIIDFLFNR